MEYRVLPHGNKKLSTIGLGLGNIHLASDKEIEKTLNYAISQGVNFFDLCGGRVSVYETFGKAVSDRREKVHTQMDYTDFGYIHCIDENANFESIMKDGLFDYVCGLKKQGVVRHIGFEPNHACCVIAFL